MPVACLQSERGIECRKRPVPAVLVVAEAGSTTKIAQQFLIGDQFLPGAPTSDTLRSTLLVGKVWCQKFNFLDTEWAKQ